MPWRNTLLKRTCSVLLIIIPFGFHSAAHASEIAEVEPNSGIATAQNIDASFDIQSSPDILHSALLPSVSIVATGDNTADYYSFTVDQVGAKYIFDLDYGRNQGGSFDSQIFLMNEAGASLTNNDDSSITAGGNGSVHGYDSYIEYTFSDIGTYLIRVVRLGTNGVDNGGTYTLQVTKAPSGFDDDLDSDGMSDQWETAYSLTDPGLDMDSDGFTNLQEFQQGSNPSIADSDNDGLTDVQEATLGTDTLSVDSDSDTMPDAWEVRYGLDPLVNDAQLDSDSDGFTNLQELSQGSDPSIADTDNDGIENGIDEDDDNDGLTDVEEAGLGTNPLSSDSDSDGMPDQWEVQYGLDPLFANADADADADGLSNIQELNQGTDPTIADTDNDGIENSIDEDDDNDGLTDVEEAGLGTNPLNSDSDADGMPDQWEVQYGLDPLFVNADADADADGFSNIQEFNQGTDPSFADTDNDGIENSIDEDDDNDGLTDVEESGLGTDPLNADTDNDGLRDNVDGYPLASIVGLADFDNDGRPDDCDSACISLGMAEDDDNDNDGLSDIDEVTYNTDPLNTDSDNDGMTDGWEVEFSLDPLSPLDDRLDTDGDGWTNLQEFQNTTDPTDALSKPITGSIQTVLNISDSGWYKGGGVHTPSNVNYVTGWFHDTNTEYRSFFGFTLPVSELFDAATLRLYLPSNGYDSPDDSEIFSVHDVTTPADTVINGTGSNAAMVDFASGQHYGEVVITAADQGSVIEIPLNNAALIRINSQSSEMFIMGGSLAELTSSDSVNERVFGYTDESSLRELILTLTDTDADGMPDSWEDLYGLDKNDATDAAQDLDVDGLVNLQEYFNRTNPTVTDSDSDGLSDGDEFITYRTAPDNADTDGDNLNDGDEFNIHGTNPLLADTDADGMADGWEVEFNLNPLLDDAADDADSDNLSNLRELELGTNPNQQDSDEDGLNDGDEINTHGTNPLAADSDNDGLTDGEEIGLGTNALSIDTDNDGMADSWEVEFNFDPLVAGGDLDRDSDGLSDAQEYEEGTNPSLQDSDGDGLNDGFEVNTYGTNPLSDDTDGDGVTDSIDALPLDSNETTDFDGDGVGDNADLDDDNDGVSDDQDTGLGIDNGLPELLAIAENISLSVTTEDGLHALVTMDSNFMMQFEAEDFVDADLEFEAMLNGQVLELDESSQVLLPAGNLDVIWTAIDDAGNRSNSMAQNIKVYPRVRLERVESIVGEATSAEIVVELTGTSPEYPVIIELQVNALSEVEQVDLADVFDILEVHRIAIESGGDEAAPNRQAALIIPILDDNNVENDEQLLIDLITVVVSEDEENLYVIDDERSQHTLTVTDVNLAPTVQLLIEQGGIEVANVQQVGGIVSMTAIITDGNGNDEHTLSWDLNDLGLNAPIGNVLSFDPLNIPARTYTLSVVATDDGINNLEGSVSINLEVVEPVVVESESSDGGGALGWMLLLMLGLVVPTRRAFTK